jgi:hypothetical protein
MKWTILKERMVFVLSFVSERTDLFFIRMNLNRFCSLPPYSCFFLWHVTLCRVTEFQATDFSTIISKIALQLSFRRGIFVAVKYLLSSNYRLIENFFPSCPRGPCVCEAIFVTL